MKAIATIGPDECPRTEEVTILRAADGPAPGFLVCETASGQRLIIYRDKIKPVVQSHNLQPI